MTRGLLAITVLTAIAFASPGSASTVAEQLAKAIYAQETSGDLDEAIRIYREVLASSPQRPQAAEAQYRLAQSLLQKGDLTGAAAEYQKLANSYPDYGDLIASVAKRLQSRSPQDTIHLGTLEVDLRAQTGRYTHKLTNVEIPLSDGWRVLGDIESSGGGQMVRLSDTVSGANGFIWLRPEDGNGDLDAKLQASLEEKHTMRNPDWKVRPESVQRRIVAGERALSAIADFDENGRNMVEYLVWIRSTKVHLFFSMTISAGDFAVNQARFDGFISGVKIP